MRASLNHLESCITIFSLYYKKVKNIGKNIDKMNDVRYNNFKGGEQMKTYEVSYRKRGLPSSDLQKMEIEAESFPGAMYLVGQKVGEEYVVVSAKLKKEKEEE